MADRTAQSEREARLRAQQFQAVYADNERLRAEVERLRELLADYRRLADPEAYRKAYADHPTESGQCGYQGCRLTLAEHHRLAYGLMSENRALRKDAGR